MRVSHDIRGYYETAALAMVDHAPAAWVGAPAGSYDRDRDGQGDDGRPASDARPGRTAPDVVLPHPGRPLTGHRASMTQASPTDPPARERRPPPSERRTRAVDALIDLVLEHGRHPRPEEVAGRAGVSIASLYRYFANLDELRRDAVARLVERFPDLFDIPEIGTGDRKQRIASFTSARFALHETLHPLQLLSRAMSHTDPSAEKHIDAARSAMADQIRRHFDAELHTLRPTRREDAVAAVAALTSVESWEQFRRTHRRTPAQTRRAWNSAIDRLLPDS